MNYEPAYRPFSWHWRCHRCRTRYRLGVTRRCLIDGHIFCSFDTVRNEPEEASSEPGTQTRKRKRRRQAAFCENRFDHLGWLLQNRWRRQVAVDEAELQGDVGFQERQKWQRNCWVNCDYPLECRVFHAQTPDTEREGSVSPIQKVRMETGPKIDSRESEEELQDALETAVSSTPDTPPVGYESEEDDGWMGDIEDTNGEAIVEEEDSEDGDWEEEDSEEEDTDTEVEDSEVEDTEVETTEAETTEAEDTEAEDTQVDDTEVEGTEVEDAEVEDAKVEDAEDGTTEVETSEVETTEGEGSVWEESEGEDSDGLSDDD